MPYLFGTNPGDHPARSYLLRAPKASAEVLFISTALRSTKAKRPSSNRNGFNSSLIP